MPSKVALCWGKFCFLFYFCVNVLQCSVREGASKTKLGGFSGECRGKCGCTRSGASWCGCKGMALHHTQSPWSRKWSEQPSSWPSDDHSGERPLPLISVLLSLLVVSEVAGRFFTVTRPIRELHQVLGHCVISVVRTSVCPGLPQLMCLLSVITPPLFVP